MTLYNQLIDHQKLARKDPNQTAIYGVLTVILGELETASKRSGEAVTDDQALTLIRKVMKGNNETLQAYKTAIPARNSEADLRNVEKLEQENIFLNCFLPQQLSADQIRTIIEKAKVDGEIKNIGMAMAFLKANYAGLYDGATASKIVKAYFEGVTSVK